MEPTILKTPSIHKGAGIYNTGAEGGGGGGVLPQGFTRVSYIENPTTNGRAAFLLPFQKKLSDIKKIVLECSLNSNAGKFFLTGFVNMPDRYSRFSIQLSTANTFFSLQYGGNSTQVNITSNFDKSNKVKITFENRIFKIEDINHIVLLSGQLPNSNDWIDAFYIGSEISNLYEPAFNGKIYNLSIITNDDVELLAEPVKNDDGLLGFFVGHRNMVYMNSWNDNKGLIAGPSL
jgi:hypothetical protein